MTEPSPVIGRALVLLRHAKAEREARVADIDRPLTARGQADALAAGAWLAHHRTVPDQVLCSPSRRTRQTWDGLRLGITQVSSAVAHKGEREDERGGADEPVVRYEPVLYHGTMRDLFDLLRAASPETGTLLVIGHNPIMSELSELLDPAGGDPGGMRTCGIAVHRVADPWADLRPGGAPLHRRHTARAV